MFRYPRSAFAPEALATFDDVMDEVWSELLADGMLAPAGRNINRARERLAVKLMTFASSGWSMSQIKQLLLRTARNERSAARHKQDKR
jgi:hypothetical protein